MSIAKLARAGRQSLTQALEALQAPDAPAALLRVAQPLAKAMGILVEIEAAQTAPAADAAEPALTALREALALLQSPDTAAHPASGRGMAAVAQSLGAVHDLGEALAEQARSAAVKAPAAQPMAATQLSMVSEASAPKPMQASAVAPVAAKAEPPQAQPAKSKATVATQVSPVAAPVPPKAETAVKSAPTADKAAPEARPAPAAKSGASTQLSPAVQPAPAKATPGGLGGADTAALKAVEAALGAHSATNFYKGLSGGDVVASGGLFVATYQVPQVGEPLLLRVSMPGGYEFEARGVVAWTRDVALSSTASGATPGFGAEFREISDEGRGLIQRYVRNREPLFHDDL